MTLLAPHMSVFLRERLPRERRASVHTCDSYAYAFKMLLCFASKRLDVRPSNLMLEQLDVGLVLAFLDDLEVSRGNSARTRNARLAAIKSFARFVEYRVPGSVHQVHGLLAIPSKKFDEALVGFLTRQEVQAVLDAPDPRQRDGVRDRAMLHLAFAAGLRVSELVCTNVGDVTLTPPPSIHVIGKGRRQRCLPLWKTTATALRAWISIRGNSTCSELFLNARGGPLTRDGFEYILARHVAVAAKVVPSLGNKRVSPHVLRHTCAMHTLQATHDIRKVALWLGHASMQSTEIYVRADPTEKLEALEAMLPPELRRGRFRAPDKVIAMLHPSERKRL